MVCCAESSEFSVSLHGESSESDESSRFSVLGESSKSDESMQ